MPTSFPSFLSTLALHTVHMPKVKVTNGKGFVTSRHPTNRQVSRQVLNLPSLFQGASLIPNYLMFDTRMAIHCPKFSPSAEKFMLPTHITTLNMVLQHY